jgi:hypothetical protein
MCTALSVCHRVRGHPLTRKPENSGTKLASRSAALAARMFPEIETSWLTSARPEVRKNLSPATFPKGQDSCVPTAFRPQRPLSCPRIGSPEKRPSLIPCLADADRLPRRCCAKCSTARNSSGIAEIERSVTSPGRADEQYLTRVSNDCPAARPTSGSEAVESEACSTNQTGPM